MIRMFTLPKLIFPKIEKKLAFFMIKIKSPTLLSYKKNLLEISNILGIRTVLLGICPLESL